MNEAQVKQLMAIKIIQAGSQQEFAKQCDISPAYLSDILMGRRKIAKNILKMLGLKRVVVYLPLDG